MSQDLHEAQSFSVFGIKIPIFFFKLKVSENELTKVRGKTIKKNPGRLPMIMAEEIYSKSLYTAHCKSVSNFFHLNGVVLFYFVICYDFKFLIQAKPKRETAIKLGSES